MYSFWTYELSKRSISSQDDDHQTHALKVLLCGGLAGVATWASIFPLDVIKTRVQTYDLRRLTPSSTVSETQSLLSGQSRGDSSPAKRPSAFMIATDAYRTEGIGVFFRGIGICSARAFIVNAVQWAVSRTLLSAHVHGLTCEDLRMDDDDNGCQSMKALKHTNDMHAGEVITSMLIRGKEWPWQRCLVRSCSWAKSARATMNCVYRSRVAVCADGQLFSKREMHRLKQNMQYENNE